MPFPSIRVPTDRLNKFAAVFGLAVVVGCCLAIYFAAVPAVEASLEANAQLRRLNAAVIGNPEAQNVVREMVTAANEMRLDVGLLAELGATGADEPTMQLAAAMQSASDRRLASDSWAKFLARWMPMFAGLGLAASAMGFWSWWTFEQKPVGNSSKANALRVKSPLPFRRMRRY